MVSCETLGVVLESAVRRCATPLRDHRTTAVAGRAMVKTAIKKDNLAAVSADPEAELAAPGLQHRAERRMAGWMNAVQQWCASGSADRADRRAWPVCDRPRHLRCRRVGGLHVFVLMRI